MSARDSDIVELDGPPIFDYGEKVVSRKNVRNDGTFAGAEIGDILVKKGEVGYVKSIGSFLQQFYIYGIDFVDRGYVVGMKGRELRSLDVLPTDASEDPEPGDVGLDEAFEQLALDDINDSTQQESPR